MSCFSRSQIKKVNIITTLSSISTVEEFTDALKSLFISDIAKAARVKESNVYVTEISAGSVVVKSEIKFEFVNVSAAIEEFKAKILIPETVFNKKLGPVEVVRQL